MATVCPLRISLFCNVMIDKHCYAHRGSKFGAGISVKVRREFEPANLPLLPTLSPKFPSTSGNSALFRSKRSHANIVRQNPLFATDFSRIYRMTLMKPRQMKALWWWSRHCQNEVLSIEKLYLSYFKFLHCLRRCRGARSLT